MVRVAIAFVSVLVVAGAVGAGLNLIPLHRPAAGGTASIGTGAAPATGRSGPVSAPGSTGSAPGATGVAPAVGLPGAVLQPLPAGSRIVRQASLTLEVAADRFDSSLDGVLQLVAAEGGFIAGYPPQPVPLEAVPQPVDGGGAKDRSAQITFQVPAGHFDETIVKLREMGRVPTMSISGTDVSTQYVDLQARLASAQAQLAALDALLQRAQSIQDILNIQQQLGQVTGAIEQLKGQLDYLDHATTYGTVTLSLAAAPVAAAPAAGGLGGALQTGWSNCQAVVGFIIVGLGTILPLLVLAAVGLAARRLWLRRRAAAAPGGP